MKLIMVDLDGTLIDTRMVNYHAYREALKDFGYDLNYAFFLDHCFGKHYKDFLPEMLDGDGDKVVSVHKAKKEYYRYYLDDARINTALVDILRLCRAVYKIALVTTASKENTDLILDHFGVSDLFDSVVTGEDVQRAKPDPQAFLIAMERFSAPPEECMIFEDSTVGIEAAKKTGAVVFSVETI